MILEIALGIVLAVIILVFFSLILSDPVLAIAIVAVVGVVLLVMLAFIPGVWLAFKNLETASSEELVVWVVIVVTLSALPCFVYFSEKKRKSKSDA